MKTENERIKNKLLVYFHECKYIYNKYKKTNAVDHTINSALVFSIYCNLTRLSPTSESNEGNFFIGT